MYLPILEEFHYNTMLYLKEVFYKSTNSPVIVSGMGRCGTTLLANAICETRGYKYRFARDISVVNLTNGKLFKTHDYPNFEIKNNDCKVVFMFGDIRNIVISATKMINRWGDNHFKNLQSPNYNQYTEIYDKDVLCLENLFDAWYQKQDFPFMSIRYEALYHPKTIKMLNDFLGFKVVLPLYKERASSWEDSPHLQSIMKVYGQLHEKIEHTEDCKIWE
ncbi:MAG: hypothetical protein ACI8RP_000927 [Urechidicola sp.]|jgi:hypothetical protein